LKQNAANIPLCRLLVLLISMQYRRNVSGIIRKALYFRVNRQLSQTRLRCFLNMQMPQRAVGIGESFAKAL
jgi:hypothetical protein